MGKRFDRFFLLFARVTFCVMTSWLVLVQHGIQKFFFSTRAIAASESLGRPGKKSHKITHILWTSSVSSLLVAVIVYVDHFVFCCWNRYDSLVSGFIDVVRVMASCLAMSCTSRTIVSPRLWFARHMSHMLPSFPCRVPSVPGSFRPMQWCRMYPLQFVSITVIP